MKAKEVIRIGRKRETRAFECGVEERFAFFVFVLGEFDDKDRVLRRQAD
mgnify:CR=1 FL=1